jgi:hypothetical protein
VPRRNEAAATAPGHTGRKMVHLGTDCAPGPALTRQGHDRPTQIAPHPERDRPMQVVPAPHSGRDLPTPNLESR